MGDGRDGLKLGVPISVEISLTRTDWEPFRKRQAKYEVDGPS